MTISALVLRDIVDGLGAILDKVEISECSSNGVTVKYNLRGELFTTRFTGDGMSYTSKQGEEAEDFVFDNHSNKNLRVEVMRHFFY